MHTFQTSLCSSSTTLTSSAILPGAGAHPYSSYSTVLADLPAGSCCKPDWGPNPAKNNSIGGVKVTSSCSRLDWKYTQNHNFRVRFQSSFNTSKFWPPQSHLDRKSPCLGHQVKLWDLQSPPAQSRGDCKSSNANQLCQERFASWQIGYSCWQEAKLSSAAWRSSWRQIEAAETSPVVAVSSKAGDWIPVQKRAVKNNALSMMLTLNTGLCFQKKNLCPWLVQGFFVLFLILQPGTGDPSTHPWFLKTSLKQRP